MDRKIEDTALELIQGIITEMETPNYQIQT